jgi:hypothetical protein
MSLQFEDQSNILLRRNMYTAPRPGFMANLLLQRGFVKDEKSANQVMLIVSILILLVAITLITINMIKANTTLDVKYSQIKILKQ